MLIIKQWNIINYALIAYFKSRQSCKYIFWILERLSKLASPDTAIITNISTAHLASFSCLKEIAMEKANICSGLKKSGLLIYPVDNEFCDLLKSIVFEKCFGNLL